LIWIMGVLSPRRHLASVKPDERKKRMTFPAIAAVAILFGLATVVSGGNALFGGEAAKLAAGNAVGFVLWFNFFAGFAYVAAGAGLAMRKRWGAWLAVGVALATAAVFAAFGLHVLGGGAYEMRTVGAMTLRSVVWIAIAVAARGLLSPGAQSASAR
jgi:hypothetical protein